jgi:hypothetical protein
MCVQVDKKYLGCGHQGYMAIRWCHREGCKGPGPKHEVVEVHGKCSDCIAREKIELKPHPWNK